MPGRIYKVTVVRASGEVIDDHLVRAISPKSAQRFATSKFINAKLAGVTDIADLMSKGAKILDGMPKAGDVEPEQSLEAGDE